jgi:hypothetical protein
MTTLATTKRITHMTTQMEAMDEYPEGNVK